MFILKNGYKIPYNENFDEFFTTIFDTIVVESKKYIANNHGNLPDKEKNDLLIKEILDNCMLITEQIATISKEDQPFANFISTGILFNSIILNMDNTIESLNPDQKNNLTHLN